MRQRRGRRERAPQGDSEPSTGQSAVEPTTTPQPPVDARFEQHEPWRSSQPQPLQQPQSYQQPQPYQQPQSYQEPQSYPQPEPPPGYGPEPEPGRRPQPGYDAQPGYGSRPAEEPSQSFDVWQSYQDRSQGSGSYDQASGWQASEPGSASNQESGYGQWLNYGQQPPPGSYEQRQAYSGPPDGSERSYRGGQHDPLSASVWPPPDEAVSYPPPPVYPSSMAPANGGPQNGSPVNGGPASGGPASGAEEPFDFESFYRPLRAPSAPVNPPPGGMMPPVQPPTLQPPTPQAPAPQAISVPPGQDPPDFNQAPGPGQPVRRRRRGRLIAVLVTVFVLLLGAAGAGGGYLLLRTKGSPRETAVSYLSAWRRQDYTAMKQVSLDVPRSGLKVPLTSVSSQLGVKHMSLSLGTVAVTGNSATALFTVTDDLTGGHVWTYQDKLPLLVKDRRWWVVWSPATIYPGLRAGERFVLSAQWPARGQIIAADGTVLSSQAADNESGSLALLTGYVGAATAAQAKKLGAPYRKGDVIGESGIEEQYQNRLARPPGADHQARRPGTKGRSHRDEVPG